MKQYRKKNQTKIISNPYYYHGSDAEVGDLFFQQSSCGNRLSRIYESKGVNKSRAGDLSYYTIYPPDGFDQILLINDKLFWCTNAEFADFYKTSISNVLPYRKKKTRHKMFII